MDTTNTSPHSHAVNSVAALMRQVMFALIPGILVYAFLFGWGILLQIFIAISCALICESAILKLRGQAIIAALMDNSAVVTALLFSLAISPYTPWWINCTGIAFAIIVVKHLYGGLGRNLFNPAMAGYVFILVSFPAQMGHWPLLQAEGNTTFVNTLAIIFTGHLDIDGLTGATPLGYMQSQLSMMAMISEVRHSPLFGSMGGKGWEWINVAFLLGGAALIMTKTINWRMPVIIITTLFIVSTLFYFINSDSYAPPLFHIFSGGTLLCAFFISTDPVTSSTTPKGLIVYAVGTGILIYIIRVWASFPDGVAFAVLIMNCAAPLIDQYTRPLILGETQS